MTAVNRIMALDPSSTATGYALFEDRKLARCGTLRTDCDSPILRCLDMADGVETLMTNLHLAEGRDEARSHVVIEIPGVFSRPGRGAALATYGMAVGCVLDRVRAAGFAPGVTLHAYTPGEWMQGMRTKERRHRLARSLWPDIPWPAPTGRKAMNFNNDAGDAALLGWWWMDCATGKRLTQGVRA